MKELEKENGTEVEREENLRGRHSVQRTKAKQPSTQIIRGTNKTLK